MATNGTRALLNPLILLYEDLAESRKISRSLREASRSAAKNGAEARSNNFSELVDTLRALVQTTKVAQGDDTETQGDDTKTAKYSGYTSLAGHGGMPDESDTTGAVFDGAAGALDQALAMLSDERRDLIHPTEQLRDDDPHRTA